MPVTQEQRALFVENVVQGMDYTSALRAAGYVTGKPSTLRVTAMRLHSQLGGAIEKRRAELASRAAELSAWSVARVLREYERQYGKADAADDVGQARAILRDVADHLGMFHSQASTDLQSVALILNALAGARTHEALPPARVYEGEALPPPPTPPGTS